ncbi:MAG: Bax inhibitor-1/YccA family protein [Vigna little leaf phytoplasma]|nr:Bax inhibitor-1/YccA family protein [Vigna little leaf phytoplasma]
MFLFNFFKLKFSKMINKLKTLCRPQNYITEKIKTQYQTETTTDALVCAKKTIIQKTVGLLSLSFLTSCTIFILLKGLNFDDLTASTMVLLGLFYIFISVFLGILLFWLHRFSSRFQKYYALFFAGHEGLGFGLMAFHFYLYYQNSFIGIVLALGGTLVLIITVYTLYIKNILRVDQKFKFLTLLFVILWSICLIIYAILEFFKVENPIFFLTILFLQFFSTILFLANDINDAEYLVTQRFPQKYEWLMAFGFHMTLINMFLHFLRLLEFCGFFRKK